MRETSAPGHGVELARAAADEGFERVIAAGGDGTVNEVANGLMRASRRATMGVWPLGSSNDYAFALGLDGWFKAAGKGVPLRPRAADVGVVSGGRREHFYLNCAGVGFNGMVALDSRKIRWLRGMPLYALAYLRCLLWHFRAPATRVEVDDTTHSTPLLALTVNVGVREGGFPITPAARVDDGRFDFVHVADLRRWDLIRLLPALMAGKIPADEPKIRTGTASRVRVTSDVPLCCHADGEFACVPADGVTELTFDTLPGRVTVEGV
jgi:diacylglycerol kinase (ATP)